MPEPSAKHDKNIVYLAKCRLKWALTACFLSLNDRDFHHLLLVLYYWKCIKKSWFSLDMNKIIKKISTILFGELKFERQNFLNKVKNLY